MRRVIAGLLVASMLAVLGSAPTSAYEIFGPRWPTESMPVAYCVNAEATPVGSNGQPILTRDEFAAVVQLALQRWEDIPEASISFAYLGLCTNAPDSYDFVNTIGWGWLWGGVIGVADAGAPDVNYLVGASYDTIYEMDVMLDIRFAQSFDDMAHYVGTVLPRILLHETGHFIGLAHTSEPCSIMVPEFNETDELCWDDIAGAAALYPVN